MISISPKKLKKKLVKVKQCIKSGWCQGALAQDYRGNAVKLTSSKATRFCLGGAILLTCLPSEYRAVYGALYRASSVPCRTQGELATLNDLAESKTYIINWLNRAIESCD